MESVSRREFLKNGALGLAGCTFALSFVGNQSSATTQNGHLRFIHVTDTHLDLGSPKTVSWVEKLIYKINREFSSVDFVLFGGDNFNNNVPGNSDALKFKNIADSLKCPWYSVRGNKESTPKPKDDQLNQSDYARIFFPSNLKVLGRNWKLEKGKYTILGLDTTIEQHNNGIYTPETLDFVEKELKTNPDRYYILLNHQTYWNFWGGTDKSDIHKYVLNNVDEVKKRLFGYPNLKLTLSGHKHLDHVGQSGTVKVISTLGFVISQNSENDHRFRFVEIKDGAVTQKVVSIA
jgi:Icc protein